MDIRSIVSIATLACAVAVPLTSAAQAKKASPRSPLSELNGVWVAGQAGPESTVTIVCLGKEATCRMATGDGDLFIFKMVAADAEGAVTFNNMLPGNRIDSQPVTLQTTRINGGPARLTLTGYSRIEFAFVRRPTANDARRIENLEDPCSGNQTYGELWSCISGEGELAEAELGAAFKAAMLSVQHSTRATQAIGFDQINENGRRESMCGGKFSELKELHEPDPDQMFCHARMMRSRAKVLARYASTNLR